MFTFSYSHFETKVLHLKYVPPRLTGYFFLSVNNKYLATSDVCKKISTTTKIIIQNILYMAK